MKHHDEQRPTERDLARSPEATADDLRALSSKYPEEVLSNPTLPLLALEDPGAYARVVGVASLVRITRELDAAYLRLDERRQRLFGADCGARVLHLVEDRLPGERRARQAIEAARRYADGGASDEELREARQRAHDLAGEIERGSDHNKGAAWAARAAEYAADSNTEYDDDAGELRSHLSAMYAAYAVPYSAGVDPRDSPRMLFEELEWQRARLASYLAEADRG
jgi:hypothetical protein